jgi:hypothetical protein
MILRNFGLAPGSIAIVYFAAPQVFLAWPLFRACFEPTASRKSDLNVWQWLPLPGSDDPAALKLSVSGVRYSGYLWRSRINDSSSLLINFCESW